MGSLVIYFYFYTVTIFFACIQVNDELDQNAGCLCAKNIILSKSGAVFSVPTAIIKSLS